MINGAVKSAISVHFLSLNTLSGLSLLKIFNGFLNKKQQNFLLKNAID